MNTPVIMPTDGDMPDPGHRTWRVVVNLILLPTKYARIDGARDERRAIDNTRELIDEAYRFHVHVACKPKNRQSNKDWVYSQFHDDWYLTTAAAREITNAIREEKRWQMESRNRWLPWLTFALSFCVFVCGLLVTILAKK